MTEYIIDGILDGYMIDNSRYFKPDEPILREDVAINNFVIISN